MLELPGPRRVQPEIGLKRNGDRNSRRHIDERAARPYGAVQGGEFVVGGGDQLHEMLAHHFGVFAVHGAFDIGVNDALRRNLGADVVVHDFGIVLRAHPGKGKAFGLRNSEALKCVFDVVRNVGPFGAHFRIGPHIGDDMADIEPVERRPPARQGHLIVNFQGFQAEQAHPLGIVFFHRNLIHDFGRQSGFHFKRSVDLVLEIVHAAVDVIDLGLLLFKGSQFCAPPVSRNWNPLSPISWIRLLSPVRMIFPLTSTWT